MAIYMSLVGDLDADTGEIYSQYPNGCFVAGGKDDNGKSLGTEWVTFDNIDWQDYRMLAETNVTNPSEQIAEYGGVIIDNLKSLGTGILSIPDAISGAVEGVTTDATVSEKVGEAFNESITLGSSSLLGVIKSKISTVEFMVDPIQFTETLSNTTQPSFIESAIEGIQQGVGTEIAWITNSNADVGIIDNLTSFLGDGMASVSESISKLVSPVTGGWTHNLFSGAIASLKGQKMIYPKIYQKSDSAMNYHFSVTLTTPYGDPYNYYMNIIVPLMHLIALAAPRMVSANTMSSPFLVQAYIPGMCTCQLGIIQNMTITKNPSTKHVSVNGYPLTVKVEFDIEELYNAMSISPANDPVSFLYNETLNDYLCNLAGLVPSQDTYAMQRKSKYQALGAYFDKAQYAQDFLNVGVERVENAFIR